MSLYTKHRTYKGENTGLIAATNDAFFFFFLQTFTTTFCQPPKILTSKYGHLNKSLVLLFYNPFLMFFSKLENLYFMVYLFFMSLVKFTCYSHLFVYFHPFFSDEGSQQSLSLVQECVVRNTKAVEP